MAVSYIKFPTKTPQQLDSEVFKLQKQVSQGETISPMFFATVPRKY